MSMIRRVFVIAILGIVFTDTMQAQSHVVYGMVHAFDSIPLIGAEVKVKSSQQIARTDSAGNFFMVCKKRDQLEISANGFEKRKVKISKDVKVVAVNLKLKNAKQIKNEELRTYAIGYGYVREDDKTTATESLRKNEASFSRYNNMYQLLTGQFPGVEVRGGEVLIRGTSSLLSSSAALIVVDGVIMESQILSQLRPMEIDNVYVIKDGSAAIYGSRGSNGVVIIETLKGGQNYK